MFGALAIFVRRKSKKGTWRQVAFVAFTCAVRLMMFGTVLVARLTPVPDWMLSIGSVGRDYGDHWVGLFTSVIQS